MIIVATVSLAALSNSVLAAELTKGGRLQLTTKKETIAWQKDTRMQLLRLMKLDDLAANKKKLQFDTTEPEVWDMGEYTFKRFTIRSTPRRMIDVVMTTPKKFKGRLPAVVCIGGHSSQIQTTYTNGQAYGPYPAFIGDGSPIYKGFAAELAKKGYVTISTVVSQHETYEEGRLLIGERLWDLMRCVDYLSSFKYVDKKRIGCAGLSLGGEMAMWLGAMDTRIAVEVSAGWLTTFEDLKKYSHCPCWNFPGLIELVEVNDIFAMTAPRPVLCQNGVNDIAGMQAPDARKELKKIKPTYEIFGAGDKCQLDIHDGAHEIDLPVLLDFFDKYLMNNQNK